MSTTKVPVQGTLNPPDTDKNARIAFRYKLKHLIEQGISRKALTPEESIRLSKIVDELCPDLPDD